MAKTLKRVISLLLAVVLVVGTFAGCGKSNKEDEAAITATAVKYTKSGQYTTTVSSKKVDLSGITADNVEVRYMDPDFVPEGTSSESVEEATEEGTTEAATEATTAAADEKVNPEETYTLLAKVESVKAADKKSYEISFTDENAATLLTKDYVIVFKGVEGDENTAAVEVEFPEITLTPDVENIVSNATQAKVTLAIDGSTFEDGISENDIYLNNAFSDMEIESVSSSDKNLTVQLKGSPVRNEAGAYQWGSINVKPSGITDGYADVTSKIDIQLASAYIDTATLKFENGKINADLKVYGIVDINTLTKDNIVIDGATVEVAEKTDENTVKLTIASDGVKSINDFADLFGGKAMKLGDYETTVTVSQASFYPVFDYVEEDGDNLKIILKLYANGGTFDEKLKTDAISFADDFKDAKVDSVKVDSDTVATLILSVPANGQTTETMKMNGTVTLAAGSLTNAWGDKTSKESAYTRDYSGETLGRQLSGGGKLFGPGDVVSEADIESAKKAAEAVKSLSEELSEFGQLFTYAGYGFKVISTFKTILEIAGAIQSEHAQIMEQFTKINQKLDQMMEEIQNIRQDIVNVQKNEIRTQLETYNTTIDKLDSKVNTVSSVYSRATKDLAKSDSRFADLDWDNMSDEEAAELSGILIDYILEKGENVKDKNYYDFVNSDFAEMKSAFESIAKSVSRQTSDNPISLYDESCSLSYNFDTQAYAFRVGQRVAVRELLAKAYSEIAIRYDALNDPDNANMAVIDAEYAAALKRLDELDDYVGVLPSEVNVDGDDPWYYPYSYVLNSYIQFKNTADHKDLDTRLSWENAIYQNNKWRKWSDDEKSSFEARLNGQSVKMNLALAGIDMKYALAENISSVNIGPKYYNCSLAAGDYWDTSGNSLKRSTLWQYQYDTSTPLLDDVQYYVTFCHDENHYKKYIEDILLVGEDSGPDAVKSLEKKGYTVIPFDLNKHTGGSYIYLGYKLTDDFDKAIKDLIIRDGKGYNSDTYDYNARTYTLCPYVGSNAFIKNKGDLTTGAGGDYLFLYYTKVNDESNTAVKMITVDNNRDNSVSGIDLNKGVTGSDDIFLHMVKAEG